MGMVKHVVAHEVVSLDLPGQNAEVVVHVFAFSLSEKTSTMLANLRDLQEGCLFSDKLALFTSTTAHSWENQVNCIQIHGCFRRLCDSGGKKLVINRLPNHLFFSIF
jgi:hypothetical protein